MQINIASLRRLIWEKGETQTSIARKAGVSRNTVSMMCNGKNCSDVTVEKVAGALGITVAKIQRK